MKLYSTTVTGELKTNNLDIYSHNSVGMYSPKEEAIGATILIFLEKYSKYRIGAIYSAQIPDDLIKYAYNNL